MRAKPILIAILVGIVLLGLAFVAGSFGSGTLDVNLASDAGSIRARSEANLQGAEAEALRTQTAQDARDQELHRADEAEILEATRGTRIVENKRWATAGTSLLITATIAALVLGIVVASGRFGIWLTRGAVTAITMPVVARIGDGIAVTVIPMAPTSLFVTDENLPGVTAFIDATTGDSKIVAPTAHVVQIGALARSRDVVSGHLASAVASAAKQGTKLASLEALLRTVREVATEAINPTVRIEAREVPAGPEEQV